MKRSLLFTIILLFPLYFGYSQEQVPAVEWAEPFKKGIDDLTISTFGNSNFFYSLAKIQKSNSSDISISKFNVDGLVKNQSIFSTEGSLISPTIQNYSSKDGGILIYVASIGVLKKYNSDLDLTWEKQIPYTIEKVVGTFDNGFYFLCTNLVNDKPMAYLKKIKDNGSIEWEVDINIIANTVTAIQIADDNGLVIATTSGLIKYSAEGKQIWSKNNIQGIYNLIEADSSSIYVLEAINGLSSGVQRINTLTGKTIWGFSGSSNIISNFEKTSDNGCIITSSNALYKYSSRGKIQWSNSNFNNARIISSKNGEVFAIKSNFITKFSAKGVTLWSKYFTYDYSFLNIHSSSDEGLYVTTKKKSSAATGSPEYIIIKLSPPSNSCKSNFNITGESSTFCKEGDLLLTSKIGNTLLKDILPVENFTFQWYRNNTAIKLENTYNTHSYTAKLAGSYSLTLTQEGCKYSSHQVDLTVLNETAPKISADNIQVCADFPVNLTADGCTGIVVWSNGERGQKIKVTPQTTTSYTAFCESTFNNQPCLSPVSTAFKVTVIKTSSLKINNISGNKEFCENTSTLLTASISGGTPPLTYNWIKNRTNFSENSNIMVNEDGKYVLHVFDKVGCTVKSDTLLIKKISGPIAPLIESSPSTFICNGNNVNITTSLKEKSYQWYLNGTEITNAIFQSYTAKIPGKYELKVTNSKGCSTTSTNSITISEIVIPQPTIKQSNDSLISSAASGNKWYFNSNEISSTSQKIKFTELGSYQVKVFDKGCESLISAVFQPSLLANEEEKFYLQLYPNPTTDKVYLKSVKLFTYKLVDVTGRLVGYTAVKQNAHTIDFSGFNSGNYFIVLEEENGNIMVKKVNVSR